MFLSVNLPGPDKQLPALDPVFGEARAALLGALPGSRLVAEGRDALGLWAALSCDGRGVEKATPALTAAEAKRICIVLEGRLHAGRLLDIDVYAAGGEPLSRQSLGWPRRGCLVCKEDAVDCIRRQRHTAKELHEAVQGLLG